MSALTDWNARMFDDYFGRPLYRSFPFACVTLLCVATLAREAWIGLRHWSDIPQHYQLAFSALFLMTPLVWVKGVAQHRRFHGLAERLAEPRVGHHSLGGRIALDYLVAATLTYAALAVALSLLRV